MTNIELYRKFEKQLLHHRLEHGVGNPLEFSIIDNMENVWYSLSSEEQQVLNAEPSLSFPTTAFIEYAELTKKLKEMQLLSEQVSTTEEETLDRMDFVWHNMREEEQEWMRRNHEKITS